MANEYYNASGAPGTGSTLSSAVLRSECQSIESGFNKLPPIAGKSGLPIFVNATATGTEAKAIADARALLLLPAVNYAHPNHTGDVTSVADGAQTIAAKAVTLEKMADMATDSFLGRDTAGVGAPEVLAVGTVQTMLGVQPNAITIGDAGRTLRMITVGIGDAADAGKIKVSVTSVINGVTIAVEDNLAKSGSTTSFTLSAGGDTLFIKAAFIGGTLVDTISNEYVQTCGTAIQTTTYNSGGNIAIAFKNATSATSIDLTSLIDSGNHTVAGRIAYITY